MSLVVPITKVTTFFKCPSLVLQVGPSGIRRDVINTLGLRLDFELSEKKIRLIVICPHLLRMKYGNYLQGISQWLDGVCNVIGSIKPFILGRMMDEIERK